MNNTVYLYDEEELRTLFGNDNKSRCVHFCAALLSKTSTEVKEVVSKMYRGELEPKEYDEHVWILIINFKNNKFKEIRYICKDEENLYWTIMYYNKIYKEYCDIYNIAHLPYELSKGTDDLSKELCDRFSINTSTKLLELISRMEELEDILGRKMYTKELADKLKEIQLPGFSIVDYLKKEGTGKGYVN